MASMQRRQEFAGGLRFADILQGYRTEFPGDEATHGRLGSALGRLLNAGSVTRVEPIRRPVRYRVVGAVSSSGLPPEVAARLIEHALEAVRDLFREAGHPVRTRAVSRELRQRGQWPDRFLHLNALLNSLAGGPQAALTRESVVSTFGRRAYHWAPAAPRSPERSRPALPPAQALVPARATAVRNAMAAASAARPLSARELRWWLEWAHSEGTRSEQRIAAQLRKDTREYQGLGRALRNLALNDASHPTAADRVRLVRTQLTCHGGPPTRYGLGKTGSRQQFAILLEDVALALRLDEENALDDVTAPSQLPQAHPTDLDALSGYRELAVRAALVHWLNGHSLTELDGGCRRELRHIKWLLALQNDSTLPYNAAYARRVELTVTARRVRILRVAIALHLRGLAEGPPGALGTVGTTSLLDLASAKRLFFLLHDAGEVAQPKHAIVFAGARRFPVSGRDTGGKLPKAGEHAALDRVDALMALGGSLDDARAPWTRGIVANAGRYLGPVFRDPAVLGKVLHERRGTEEWNIALVASALLGVLPLESLTSNDTSALRAIILSMALLFPERAQILSRLEALLNRGIRGETEEILDTAIRRLSAGSVLLIAEP